MAKLITDASFDPSAIKDPRFQPKHWIPASKKRLFLAAYIDYLLIGIPWMLFEFIIRSWIPEIDAFPVYWRWLLFGMFELSVFRFDMPSPGANFLSIRHFEYYRIDKAGRRTTARLALVDSWIKSKESWFSMIVAIIFLNEGAKSAVRWMMWNPSFPFFGMEIDEVASAGVYTIIGAAEITIGYYLLKIRMQAFLIGFPYIALTTLSAIVSWHLWDPFVAEMVIRRRAYQGLPARERSIEYFQAMVPEGIIIGSVLLSSLLLILTIKYLRIRRSLGIHME